MTQPETIGARVRRLRELTGLSGPGFQLRSGVYPTHLYEIERGNRQPSLETLYSIGVGLGVSVPELLEGTEWDRRARG